MESTSPLVDVLTVGGVRYRIAPLDRVPGVAPDQLVRCPITRKVLAENVLRHATLGYDSIRIAQALLTGEGVGPAGEIPFHPERILLQDFTGVPVLVDLTGLRTAARRAGLDAGTVNPTVPVDLIVDHSVQVDSFGSSRSLGINLDHEYERNSERYRLLRWAQGAFEHVRIVPPGNGICHQVNLEYLSSVVTERSGPHGAELFPDTLLGTDSHTTMVNGAGVLGWGVGGIEAEAAMLGEPYFVSEPKIVGVRLSGQVPEGSTATDLVLTVTRLLREHGVVDKFVEFYGPGLPALSVPDRATISNMCPEYGATAALFPVDASTIRYLTASGRPVAHVQLVEAYARRQGLWHEPGGTEPTFDERLELDLAHVVPTISGPKNPEESVPLTRAAESFRTALRGYRASHPLKAASPGDGVPAVNDGAIVIAAITSCTNTSNPDVMIGAGLIAQKARALGLKPPATVKTSMAPGSKVVTDYLRRSGLLEPLEAIGFSIVGYGCTTCIGNSGPLPPEIEAAVRQNDAYVAAVLSGNRNFEARINNFVRANYLMSPMLVVAYALAGRMDLDLRRDPIGRTPDGRDVHLAELWPTTAEIRTIVDRTLTPGMFETEYREITKGDPHWESLDVAQGVLYPWDAASTYLKDPPYFDSPPTSPPASGPLLQDARVLAVLGDQVSTDHISPAGAIPKDSPAGEYLLAHGVEPSAFNTYGARRGNHEIMIRGTFGNVRLKNALAGGLEGGWTVHLPSATPMTIYAASERYRTEGVPLIVLAGANYGQGSSRDWAAKGPQLLGVRAVIAQSFERIHRSNLIAMGIVPLEFAGGAGVLSLGLIGRESFTVAPPPGGRFGPRVEMEVTARADDGRTTTFRVRCRIDSAPEMAYHVAGGILPYVLGRMVARGAAGPTGRAEAPSTR